MRRGQGVPGGAGDSRWFFHRTSAHLPSRAVSVPGPRAATASPASAGVPGPSCGALRRPSPVLAPLWEEGTTGSLLPLPSCSLPFPAARAGANPAGKQQRARSLAWIKWCLLGDIRRGRAHRRFLEFAQAPASLVIAPAAPLTLRGPGVRGRCRCLRLPTGYSVRSAALRLICAVVSRGGRACALVAHLPGRRRRLAGALPGSCGVLRV